jgi:hypothetical protein
MRRMPILVWLLVMLFSSSFAAPPYTLEQLQGAWWSDPDGLMADFGIHDNEVWIDSIYYPCRLEGDILIFVLPDVGEIKKRIISLEGDQLIIEHESTKTRTVLNRAKS